MAQVFLDAHPHHVLIKTDFTNAFNLVPRRLILHGLQTFCPRLIPWFQWAYGAASPLVDAQGRTMGASATGCRQGDPLASLLFCVAIQAALQDVQELLEREYASAMVSPTSDILHPGYVLGYMDDLTIAVPAALANRVATALEDIFRDSGLILNKAKCRFVGPLSTSIAAPYFTCVPDGDIILGSPTGTEEFRTTTCEKMVDGMAAPLPTLAKLQLDPLISTNLLRYCINARPSYLARVQDHDYCRPALHDFDQRVDQALCSIAEHVPVNLADPDQLDSSIAIVAVIRSLPLHRGGFGIARHSWLPGQVGCIRSRELTRSFVQEYYAGDTAFSAAMAQWTIMTVGEDAEDAEDTGQDTPVAECRMRMEAEFIATAADLHQDLLAHHLEAQAAWWLSSQFEGSGRWVSPPIGLRQAPHLVIRDAEYRQAMRARLLLHPLQEQIAIQPSLNLQCVCRDHPDAQIVHQQAPQFARISLKEPFHYLDCFRRRALMKRRHDAVIQILEAFVKKRFPLIAISREPELPTKDDVTTRVVADLRLTLPHIGRQFVIDGVVCNPAAPTYRNPGVRSHETPQAANNKRDQLKIAHYHDLTRPDITRMDPRMYYTFNVEATGRLGPSAEQFITELFRASGRSNDLQNTSGPSPILALTKDIGTAIAKVNAQAALLHKREVSFAQASSHAD